MFRVDGFEAAEHTGIVAAAIVGVFAAARALWIYLVRPTYKVSVGDKLDALDVKLQAFAEDTAAQIAKLESQLHTNGGASLRDQTNRIEQKLGEHVTDAGERLRIAAIEINAANRRIDQMLAQQLGVAADRRAGD